MRTIQLKCHHATHSSSILFDIRCIGFTCNTDQTIEWKIFELNKNEWLNMISSISTNRIEENHFIWISSFLTDRERNNWVGYLRLMNQRHSKVSSKWYFLKYLHPRNSKPMNREEEFECFPNRLPFLHKWHEHLVCCYFYCHHHLDVSAH